MIVAARLVVLCLVVALTCGFALVTQKELAEIRSGQSGPALDVSSLYTDKIVPYAKSHAHAMGKIQKVLNSDSAFKAVCKRYGIQKSQAYPCVFWVSLTGTIKDINHESQVGKMEVQVDGGKKATVLLGPVIPGADIRNGYPGVSYNDFDSQSAFADLADSLNDQVVKTVNSASDELRPGKRIKIVGAYALWGAPAAGLTTVVPVIFESS